MQSPAGDATTNICNGVMTIQVGTTVSDGDSSMKNAVTSKINQFFGKAPNQIADYVIYCLPPNTTSGIAYVYQLVALDLLGPLVQLSISIHAWGRPQSGIWTLKQKQRRLPGPNWNNGVQLQSRWWARFVIHQFSHRSIVCHSSVHSFVSFQWCISMLQSLIRPVGIPTR